MGRNIFLKLTWVLVSLSSVLCATFTPASQIASLYSLTSSTAPPFPTQTLSTDDTDSFLVGGWSLSKGKVQDSSRDISFIDDPFPNSPPPGSDSENTTSPVLRVVYPANTFGSSTDGTQFYSLFNNSSPFLSMLLSYEVAFDQNFQWVKGGKLPGIRGGPNPDGCSGGSQPNGTDCFSTRIMWRPNGSGEVYAYIPRPNNLCSNPSIICNPDFGVSIQRGAFGFKSGSWNRVSLLVQLNNPPNVANGYVALFFNDIQAIKQTGLQLRASDVISAGGLYFSTFFGGDDTSWAPPADQNTYFRNIQVWAGSTASNSTNQSASSTHQPATPFTIICFLGLFLYLS